VAVEQAGPTDCAPVGRKFEKERADLFGLSDPRQSGEDLLILSPF